MLPSIILFFALTFSLILVINVIFTSVAGKERDDSFYMVRWLYVLLTAANWAYFYHLTH